MKFLKSHYFSASNALIALLMALLGFASSCSKEPMAEYGTPSAKFIIKGTVKSSQSSLPVSNIQILVSHLDTVYTDENGNYELNLIDFPNLNSMYRLLVKDVDDAANGSYKDKTVEVLFENPEFKNGDGKWYYGEVTRQVPISITPK